VEELVLKIRARFTACVLIAAAGAAAVATTSSASQAHSAATPKIYVIVKDTSNPYWLAAERGGQAAAKLLKGKATVSISAGTSETVATSEVAKVQDAISAGANAIVIAPTVPSELKPVLTEAKSKGIKVVLIDTPIPGFKGTFVGTNNVAAGEVQARTVNGILKGHGTVGIITGPAGISSLDGRLKGFEAGKAKGIQVVQLLRTQTCAEAEGVTDAQNLLTAHPTLSAIVTECGDPAVGAAQVLKQQHKVGKVKLIGLDGNPLEAKDIAAGLETASIAQYPNKMGEIGVETALKLIQGTKAPAVINTGVGVVTKKNAKQFGG
jgi:simple sugar transport system substrate-binding protein